MNKLKLYIKLMRPKHYIKNILIFVPLFFSKQILNIEYVTITVLAFVSFSLLASCVYIINDLKDVDKDKLHPTKNKRPIASGAIKKNEALILLGINITISMGLNLFLLNFSTNLLYVLLSYFGYLLINIFYCFKGKNIPIIDVFILAMSYFLRIFYGASITNIIISDWLYLSIIAVAFYLGFGKRRNEIRKIGKKTKTRQVLKSYNETFLTCNMYMFLGLGIMFYSLWSMQKNAVITVPFLILLCLKYSFNIEGDSDGDPVEVMFADKWFLPFVLLFVGLMVYALYIK